MNSYTLTQLDTLLKHNLVHEYKERDLNGMCINEFLPLCAALLYPFRNAKIQDGNHISNVSYIKSIINSIKKFTIKYNNLDRFSLDGLRIFFQHEWLPTVDYQDQVRLIKGNSLITSVEDEGFFSIKNNENVLDAYLRINVIDISNNYGCESFSPLRENDSQKNDKIVLNEDHNQSNIKESVSLEPIKEFLKTCIPLSRYPKGLKQFNYFWKYKLNNDQYLKLKGILKDLDLKDNIRLLSIDISGHGKVARIVALYVSEWYKRECTSLDGDKCLEEIGLSGKSSNIWKYADLDASFLHHEDGNNQMRQMAMCALGGLPINYVNGSQRFKEFVNGLFNIYEKENISEEDIENVIKCFDDNNGVFKRSLESGSCNEYLNYLVSYLESDDKSKLPFSEDDVERVPFSGFIKSLREGYDNELSNNFITSEIRIWTDDYTRNSDDSNSIECEFYAHIGLRKSKNVITSRELVKLGISLPANTNTFNIRLKITDKDGNVRKSDECRTYFKIGNGCDDFCGAYGSDISATIDFFTAKKISLWLECGEYNKEIYKCQAPLYLELYSTNNFFLWTTKTNNAARKVLFYDKDVYTPIEIDDSDIQTKTDGENYWGWIYLNKIITIQDFYGNKKQISLGQSERIIVDFRTRELERDVKLYPEGCVQSVINGEVGEPVHLLYFSDGKRHLMLTCDEKEGEKLNEYYKLEYKNISSNETRYTEWTRNNCPSQGFIKMRIRCRDISKKKSDWIGVVYFIPAVGPFVWRNLENNYIYFFKSDNIKGDKFCPTDESIQQYYKKKDNKFKDGLECGLNTPTISFRIGDKDNHIIVDVYRALSWQQIWNNGKLIKDVVGELSPPPIAIILQNNITIKKIDKNGYKEYTPKLSKYLDLFRNPKDISRAEALSGPFKYYIYLSKYEDVSGGVTKVRKVEKKENTISLYVSDKHIDKYVFYYWSGDLNDTLIKLEWIKRNSNKYECIIPSPLREKALIFQSLKEYSPNFYFRPFYDESWPWDSYVNRYNTVSLDYVLKCYQHAVNHKVYFCIFPALRILQNRDDFTTFIRKFIKNKKYHLSPKDVGDLTRLAQELSMDWFFVNRRQLFEGLDEESKKNMRGCITQLLLKSPIVKGEKYYSIRFINTFLNKVWPFGQRNGKRIARQFLKLLDGSNDFARSFDGNNNCNERIRFLNELVSTQDNLFQEICQILNI